MEDGFVRASLVAGEVVVVVGTEVVEVVVVAPMVVVVMVDAVVEVGPAGGITPLISILRIAKFLSSAT